MIRKSFDFFGKELICESGRLAKQAHGSAFITYGDNQLLVTVAAKKDANEDAGFFPLAVEYIEKKYAVGRMPGGFFKREGKPSSKEVLSARMVDRPIRPLFPELFKSETQVVVTVLSNDGETDIDVLGTLGASLALNMSDIPFQEPVASVRVARLDGEFIINPTYKQIEESDIELVVAATLENILMIEGEAKEIPESEILEAINFGHQAIRQLIAFQNEFLSEMTITKRELKAPELPSGLKEMILELGEAKIKAANQMTVKEERRREIDAVYEFVKTEIDKNEAYQDYLKYVNEILHHVEYTDMRSRILDQGIRLDGRTTRDIRPLQSEIGLLKRAHGSALFTRGQTQVLGVTTLGTKQDEQILDGLEGEKSQSYYLQYNFPPYSTGEVKRMMSVSRREIGHGNLAERSLKPILPSEQSFPYTIRIVSEVLESNGSSSMATICASSLSLMHAGVPIKTAVAGIAMGLIKEGDKVAVLTDILGDEDHLGDMDFKVAGTKDGVTAFQMDIKIGGISEEIMQTALNQAKEARHKILDNMNACISKPNADISIFAPRILQFRINPEKIGLVIGPGGKQIREIIEKTGVTIDIDNDGTVKIASNDSEKALLAKSIVDALVEEAVVGKTYRAKVIKVMDFGAFMEIFPGKEGLMHISEYDWKKTEKIADHVKVGDVFDVICKAIDNQNRINLSRKALLPKPEKVENTDEKSN